MNRINRIRPRVVILPNSRYYSSTDPTQVILRNNRKKTSNTTRRDPLSNLEYVEDEEKHVSSQAIFNELVQHPKKQLTELQKTIHSPNFQIPEQLKDINNELKWYKENNVKDIKTTGYDPTEHTLARLLFGNALEQKDEVQKGFQRDVRGHIDPIFDPTKLKPLSQVAEILENIPIKSNILKLKTRDSLLIETDFERIFPVPFERQFDLGAAAKLLKFNLVKGRFPTNLQRTGVIYLIFKDFLQAGCYYLETLKKQLNGQYLEFEFADPIKELPYIQAPQLADIMIPPKSLTNLGAAEGKTTESSSIADYLTESKLRKANEEAEVFEKVLDMASGDSQQQQQQQAAAADADALFNHTPITSQSNKPKQFTRSQACFFSNLPQHITTTELEDTLWDYNLFDLEMHSIKKISDRYWLIVFEDKFERDRCIRQFDGRHWYNNVKMPLVSVEAY